METFTDWENRQASIESQEAQLQQIRGQIQEAEAAGEKPNPVLAKWLAEREPEVRQLRAELTTEQEKAEQENEAIRARRRAEREARQQAAQAAAEQQEEQRRRQEEDRMRQAAWMAYRGSRESFERDWPSIRRRMMAEAEQRERQRVTLDYNVF